MMKKEDLIRENHELRARLELAQSWMKREIQSAMTQIQKETTKKTTRKHFSNIFEEEGESILAESIDKNLGQYLPFAPKFTHERLLDAEIYWNTLQKYPHMDAFPVIVSYQKILDAWVEETLIADWRAEKRERYPMHPDVTDPIDRDLSHIVIKGYSLSLGRFYQVIEKIISGKTSSIFLSDIYEFWKSHNPSVINMLLSDDFFGAFTLLTKSEVFSAKRHEKKVSYKDAENTRKMLLGEENKKGIFHLLFTQK